MFSDNPQILAATWRPHSSTDIQNASDCLKHYRMLFSPVILLWLGVASQWNIKPDLQYQHKAVKPLVYNLLQVDTASKLLICHWGKLSRRDTYACRTSTLMNISCLIKWIEKRIWQINVGFMEVTDWTFKNLILQYSWRQCCPVALLTQNSTCTVFLMAWIHIVKHDLYVVRYMAGRGRWRFM